MGIYTSILPLSVAMVLHGFAQMSSNGFRAWFFRDSIEWKIILPYGVGSLFALALFFWIMFIPEKNIAFLLLGTIAIASPFVPRIHLIRIDDLRMTTPCGFVIASTQLSCGVSGPMLDLFFLHSRLNRHQVIGTKSLTQCMGHTLKLIYYSSFLGLSVEHDLDLPYWILGAIILVTLCGASIGKFFLQFINEQTFRQITRIFIFLLGFLYLGIGLWQTGLPTSFSL